VAERTAKDNGAEDGDDWTVCNHLVAIQTQFSSETETSAKWSALDFSIDPPSYRSFEARFKGEQDARDFKLFKDSFYEGKDLAEQSEILELPANANPEEYYYGEGNDFEEQQQQS